MANTFTIGRLSFTSPEALAEAAMPANGKNSIERSIQIRGTLVANSLAEAKTIRDELISLSNSQLIVPFTYEGDTTYGGYCIVESADVNTKKLTGIGLFRYNLSLLVKGRIGEIQFESNFSGGYLSNSHGLSSTEGPWHALPVNMHSYTHPEAPTALTRATNQGTVYMFQDADLRDGNANWYVNPSDYYKGAAQITIDGVVRNGYLTSNEAKGVVITNGIIQITSGSTLQESRFNLSFYDNGEFVSEREIAISRGASEDEWNVWQNVQILRNDAEEASVRFSTYSETAGDGKLTVDITIRRGAHHASIIATQGATASRSANSRINLKLIDANAMTENPIVSNYMIEDTADSDGQKFFIGSPMGVTFDETNRLMHITTDKFKSMIGYIYGTDAHNDAASVYEQYMDSVYEQVRLVRS